MEENIKSFSILLEEFRRSQQLNKKELAELAGLTPGYISHLTLRKRDTPSIETVEALANALQLSEENRTQLFKAAGYSSFLSSPATLDSTSLFNQDQVSESSSSIPQADWGEAPNIKVFYGREQELKELERWVVNDNCQMIAILGMGGIGKTALAAKLAEQTQHNFERLFWRSLQNTPRIENILQECIQFLSGQEAIELPKEADEQISLLLTFLRKYRCLIVLDNVESLLQENELAGQYRKGYEEYGRLFRLVGEAKHKSCLLLTSREKPREMARMEGKLSPVHSMQLPGIGEAEGCKILEETGLTNPDKSWTELISLYSGNPLALKLASELIREVFGGSIVDFLKKKEIVFGDIHDLLDQQFRRLSTLEQEMMYWLTIEREAISLEDLLKDLVQTVSEGDALIAIGSLRRRFMIEALGNASIYLQPVIREYVTNELIEQIYEEIKEEKFTLLGKIAIIKAQAKNYVRENQTDLILTPLANRLLAEFGKKATEKKLNNILSSLHKTHSQRLDYAAGNVLNLLIKLQCDISGYDFSHLLVRQAYLKGVELHRVNFAYADLRDSIFTDAFGSILSVALSPNGEMLAVGTANGEVRLLNVADGTSSRPYYGHTNTVRSVAFSSDGRFLASGSDDQTVRLWEVGTGQCLRTLQGHDRWVYSVTFSPDGYILASGSEDQTIRLWDVSTGSTLKILHGHKSGVFSIAFSSDGKLLASGSDDQTVQLWEVSTWRNLKTLEGHSGKVCSVAFGPDGRLASSSEDQTVRLWEVSTGQNLKILKGHQGRVMSVAFSPDGKLASGGEDQTVRLWEVSTGQNLKILKGHQSRVISVAFSPDGTLLASGSDDQTARLWDVNTGFTLKTLEGHSSRVRSVAFSPDGMLLASGSEDRMVRLWEVSTWRNLKTLEGHTSWVRSVAFSPDGTLLASGSEDQTVWLWDINTCQKLGILKGHTHQVRSVAFSPDGALLASGSEDQTVRLWDINTRSGLKIFKGHSSRVWSVAFSPDSNILASSSDDQTIRLWDVSTGHTLKILKGHNRRIYSIAFSPDGRLLASSSEDQTTQIWDVDTGQNLKVLKGHSSGVWSVAFSPDGTLLASGSDDRTVRLWRVSTGECLHVLQGHSQSIYSVAFYLDGNSIASGSDDGTIRIWNAQTGVCLRELRGDRPYERMNVAHAQGLTEMQKEMLIVLGAIEN